MRCDDRLVHSTTLSGTSCLLTSFWLYSKCFPVNWQAYAEAKQIGLKSYAEEDGSDASALEAMVAKREKEEARTEAEREDNRRLIAAAVGSAMTAKAAAAKSQAGGSKPQMRTKPGVPLMPINTNQLLGSKRQAEDSGLGAANKRPMLAR